jgi:polyhydroxyalkanoate synthesis regulator phasin
MGTHHLSPLCQPGPRGNLRKPTFGASRSLFGELIPARLDLSEARQDNNITKAAKFTKEKTMFELIKKSLLTGLGLAVVTKAKLEAILGKLVEEGKLSREESEKFREELLRSGEEHWNEMEEKISKSVKDLIGGMDICRKEDLRELNQKFLVLEIRLTDLEKRLPPASQG